MRVTKHFLQSIFRYKDVCRISLPSYVDYMHIFVSCNFFCVHLNIILCTSRIPQQQKRSFEQTYSKVYEPKQPPLLVINIWRNYSTTCMICDHRHANQLQTHMVTHGSDLLASTNHQRSFRVRYISTTRLPQAVLLFAVVLLLLLLQHTNNISVSPSNHPIYCTWLNAHYDMMVRPSLHS